MDFREKIMTTKQQKKRFSFTKQDFLKDLKKVSKPLTAKPSPKPSKYRLLIIPKRVLGEQYLTS